MEPFQAALCYKNRILKGIFVVICACYFFYPALHRWIPDTRNVMIVPAPRSSVIQTDTCHRVLSDARLSYTNEPWFYLNGCTLHNYTQSDAQSCMRRVSSTYGVNNIAIVGDSRMRNFFIALTKILGKPNWDIPVPLRHADFHYYNPDIDTLVFLRFRGKMDSEIFEDYQTWLESPVILRPRVVIQGNALWDLTFGGSFEESSKNFKANFSKILPYMEGITSSTDVLWMLQDPTDDRKMDAANIELRGKSKVNAYNNISVDVLSKSSVKIWTSSRNVALRFPNESDAGGIHYKPVVLLYKVQLFLNWYCNRHMDLQDGRCCTRPDDRQLAILTILHPLIPSIVIIILLVCILGIYLVRTCQKNQPRYAPYSVRNISKLDGWKVDALGKS